MFAKFENKIFNALVDRIEILEPMHFTFILKLGIEGYYGNKVHMGI
ncbi:MAG: recombinase [Marinisporobacter sp.]|jgi:hypothetical protein|nr:recombinase [Marinisporobacter sp.]